MIRVVFAGVNGGVKAQVSISRCAVIGSATIRNYFG